MISTDTLKVKIYSDTCDDTSGDCAAARGHITINGHQHTTNVRGINAVLFDYRSGVYEHRSSYDVYGFANARTTLTNFLNGLTSGKILFMSVRDSVTLDKSSAMVLQRFGVSATFATTSLPKSRCSMATVAYTGGERKEWEQSINKVGGTGASVIEKTIYIFRELDGRDDCSQEMGIQSRKIPDSAFSAKSIWNNDAGHFPNRARLHNRRYSGWCSAKDSPVTDYLQVDIGTVKLLTGIAIQGDGLFNGVNYVTKFVIDYSTDGSTWVTYKDIGSSNTRVFDGIRRKGQWETGINWFNRTMARYIRIIPSARETSISVSCIRMELYGCTPKVPIFQHGGNDSPSREIQGTYSNSLTLHYTAPAMSHAILELSTAPASLHVKIDQVHFLNVNASITSDGALGTNEVTVKMKANQTIKTDPVAIVEHKAMKPSCHALNVDYKFMVSIHSSAYQSPTINTVPHSMSFSSRKEPNEI